MFFGVNVSAREVQQPGFVDGVRDDARARPGSSRRSLVLEITETALLRRRRRRSPRSTALRELGVRTVIDDFGTGYFSLSHLRQFPVDILKIAGEFVQDADADSKSSALAGAIVAMGRSLRDRDGRRGHRDRASRPQRMRALGCTYGQGYFFAHPLAEAQIEGGGPWLESAVREQRAARQLRGARTRAISVDPAAA